MKSQSVVTDLRRKVFTEVARVAYLSDNPAGDLEEIPYLITPNEVPQSSLVLLIQFRPRESFVSTIVW